MSREVLGAAYILLGLAILVSLVFHLKQTGRGLIAIDSITIVHVGLLAYYVAPGIRNTLSSDYVISYSGIRQIFEPTPLAFFCVVLFFLFYLFGVIKTFKYRKNHNQVLELHVSEYGKYESTARNITIAALVFSLVTFGLYTLQFGGPFNLMANVYAIRSGDVKPENPAYMFLSKLFNCVMVAPATIFPYRRTNRALTVFAVGAALMITLSSGSRGGVLLLALLLILGESMSKTFARGVSIRRVAVGAVAVILATIILRPVLESLQLVYSCGISCAVDDFIKQSGEASNELSGNLEDPIAGFVADLSHYSISLEMALITVESGEHQPNMFMEIPYAALSVLPTILLGIKTPRTITSYNTFYLTGGNDFNVPAGVVAAGYYTAGFLGIVVFGWLAGRFGRRIDSGFRRWTADFPSAGYYYVLVLFIFFGFAVGGGFASVFQRYVTTIGFVAMARYMTKPAALSPISRDGKFKR
jgi:MFS family permease